MPPTRSPSSFNFNPHAFRPKYSTKSRPPITIPVPKGFPGLALELFHHGDHFRQLRPSRRAFSPPCSLGSPRSFFPILRKNSAPPNVAVEQQSEALHPSPNT